jgi:hypothetical protein
VADRIRLEAAHAAAADVGKSAGRHRERRAREALDEARDAVAAEEDALASRIVDALTGEVG